MKHGRVLKLEIVCLDIANKTKTNEMLDINLYSSPAIPQPIEGALIAAQGYSKQNDYLPMKIPTKFTEASAPVIAKAEFRVETLHKCELWSSCLPHVG